MTDEDGHAHDAEGEQRADNPQDPPRPCAGLRAPLRDIPEERDQTEGKGQRHEAIAPLCVIGWFTDTSGQLLAGLRRDPRSHGAAEGAQHDEDAEAVAPGRAQHAGDEPDRTQRQQHHDGVDDERVNRQACDGVED